jgi:hypothetical protein
MNPVRLLLLAGLVWLVWKVLKSWRVEVIRREPPAPERFEPMARCARCGLHLPAQSLSVDGRCGACSRRP